MMTWFISRLFSYLTIIEFFDHLAEYTARGTVTVKGYLSLSEYVDTVDSSIPAGGLLVYELILLAVIFGAFLLVGYLVSISKKSFFEIRKVARTYGRTLLVLGSVGIASRLLTFISINCFLNSAYVQYHALGTSFIRDVLYIVLGVIIVSIVKHNEMSS